LCFFFWGVLFFCVVFFGWGCFPPKMRLIRKGSPLQPALMLPFPLSGLPINNLPSPLSLQPCRSTLSRYGNTFFLTIRGVFPSDQLPWSSADELTTPCILPFPSQPRIPLVISGCSLVSAKRDSTMVEMHASLLNYFFGGCASWYFWPFSSPSPPGTLMCVGWGVPGTSFLPLGEDISIRVKVLSFSSLVG